jgi:hypothetical protein
MKQPLPFSHIELLAGLQAHQAQASGPHTGLEPACLHISSPAPLLTTALKPRESFFANSKTQNSFPA